MYDQLYQSIHEVVSLSDEEWDVCKNCFQPQRLLKGQFFLQENQICRQIAFIEMGALVSYAIDPKGTQHVMQFGFEGWWMADLQSFLTNTPSTLHIEVLEDAELLLINQEKQDKLLKEIPQYGEYICILFQNAYVALQQRVEHALGLTAEEKYSRLLDRNPQFMDRVPQHLIASYLGVSPETLSRVRGQISR